MLNQSTESDRKAILLSFLASKAKFISLLRRTWRSTFLPETIFRRSVLFIWRRPLQKKGHWKTSLMGMKMSEKWRRESVNQQIPFVHRFPGYCYCYGYYYQTPTTFGYSSKKIWRATTLPVDLAAFKKERNRVMNLMSEARLVKYNQFIEDNSTDRRRLFLASKSLMNMKKDRSPPPHSDVSLLANDMGQFFYCQDYQYQVKAGRHSSITSSAVNARAQPGIWIWWYCIFPLPMPSLTETVRHMITSGKNKSCIFMFRLTPSCHY